MKKLFSFLVSIGVLYALSAIQEAPKTLEQQISERKIPKKYLKIYIEKAKRTLSVYYQEEKLITYPCVLGYTPEGDKMQEGDGKTPEGIFGVRSMYPHKSWSYFIWIDYPNQQSWSKFNERKKKGDIEQSATIGGEIGIHGVPSGSNKLIDNKQDWTLGCISLKTEHITDLFWSISKQTKIEIVP